MSSKFEANFGKNGASLLWNNNICWVWEDLEIWRKPVIVKFVEVETFEGFWFEVIWRLFISISFEWWL